MPRRNGDSSGVLNTASVVSSLRVVDFTDLANKFLSDPGVPVPAAGKGEAVLVADRIGTGAGAGVGLGDAKKALLIPDPLPNIFGRNGVTFAEVGVMPV